MKLLNKFSISQKNQLKKYIFVYIVLILFCLLLVFLLVGNLDNIWRSIHETNRVETDSRAEYQAVVKLSEKLEKEHIAQAKQDTAVEKTVVWGTGTASYKAVALQLNNMKEDFRTEEQLEECAGAEILFVCKTDFNDQEIQMLEEYSRAGAALFFTEIPSEAALEKKSVKDLLGIDTYKGIQEKKGIRLTENLLFGEITESRESFTMKSVTLKRQAEVYGSALQSKKVKNENLAPVFWRYQSSAEGGSIYVADRELMAGTMVYAVVSFLFTDLYQAYMYPIVNAYCFAVSGMPYTDEFTSEYLEKEYGIARFEWESCGYDMAFPVGKNSLHLPFYQTNTSQYCTLYAKCTTGERGKQKLVKQCPGFCKDYAFLYPDHLKMVGRYNSLFALDSRIFEDDPGFESGIENEVGMKTGIKEMVQKWKTAGTDRLVVNLL